MADPGESSRAYDKTEESGRDTSPMQIDDLESAKGKRNRSSSSEEEDILQFRFKGTTRNTIKGAGIPPQIPRKGRLLNIESSHGKRLDLGRDEYVHHEFDTEGERKVSPNGHLLGGRRYRVRTFTLPNRGAKLFMLLKDCTEVLRTGSRFSLEVDVCSFNADMNEKNDLVRQGLIPYAMSVQIVQLVAARSMFREYGSRLIEGGHRVRDDYWEAKAKKQGFTEDDPADKKQPKRPDIARAEWEASDAAILPPGSIFQSMAHNLDINRTSKSKHSSGLSNSYVQPFTQTQDSRSQPAQDAWKAWDSMKSGNFGRVHSSPVHNASTSKEQNNLPLPEIQLRLATFASQSLAYTSSSTPVSSKATNTKAPKAEDRHAGPENDIPQSLEDVSKTNIETGCRSFIDSILRHMEPSKNGEHIIDYVVQIMPGLLRAFTMSVSRPLGNIEWSNKVDFIAKHNRTICTTFKEQWLLSKHNLDKQDPKTQNLPSDKLTNVQNMKPIATDAQMDLEERMFHEEPTCQWLIARIRNSFRLTIPEASTFDNVHDTILGYLMGTSVNSTLDSLPSMRFELGVDIKDFFDLRSIGDKGNWRQVLNDCITLSSDGKNIQALTCSQYLTQVWPERGSTMLAEFLDLLSYDRSSNVTEEHQPKGEAVGGKIQFYVSGEIWRIAEIGEQLTWFCSAFRSSSTKDLIHQCTARVTAIGKDKPNTFGAEHCCVIRFDVSKMEQDLTPDQCWQGLFKYPVVAKSFPIARREKTIPGMEMALGTMTALCQARHVGKFGHSIVIKGYSSMFTLTERRPGLSVWHFRGSLDGDYMPYPDTAELIEFRDLGVHEIAKDRHFVGWCSKSTYGTGAIDSNYNIRHSGLLGTYPGGFLHEKSLRRGLRLQEEKIHLVTDKKSPRHMYPKSYLERLKRLHSRPIILWDTETQRGWLTNGTSALLHLTFASLENDAKDDDDDPFAHAFQFQRSAISHPDTHTDGTAAKILLEQYNLELAILSHGGERVFFKDRVEDILFLLELMIEHQTTAVQTVKSSFDIIDGWDFMDVADLSHEVLHPRTFTPDTDDPGWITLLRDTCAVTLYGRGFGEIYKPADHPESCEYWASLPKGKCYIAASIRDLEKIVKSYNGDDYGNPRRLTENTYWPSTFDTCTCGNDSTEHRNLVQILVPRQSFKGYNRKITALPTIPKLGAVIFGRADGHRRPEVDDQVDSKLQIKDSVSTSRCSSEARVFEPMNVVQNILHDREDYLTAIICALPKELLAVRLLFDQLHDDLDTDEHDTNRYAFGKMSGHNVVAACLPSGIYGTCSAANVASQLRRSFPKIRFCLVVGIGGGIPSSQNDVRLGDVVISHPANGYSGIIKYDLEKVLAGKTPQNIGALHGPPEFLLAAISALRSDPNLSEEPLKNNLDVITQRRPKYSHPGRDLDRLYSPDFSHSSMEASCTQCVGETVHREPRESDQPLIHYGLIASGDKVVKDPVIRDRVGNEFNAICIEMEAAGIANILPSLVIRGICDYSDSHKHKIWQEYACASAASYAKVLLRYVKHRRNGET